MANTITLKKSGVAARVPTTASLSLGEIALNYKDGYLFYRDDEASPAVHKLNAADADTVDGFHLDQGVLTTSSPSFAGLTVDTNTLSVDSTNNKVGIGTTSPSAILHTKIGTSNSAAYDSSVGLLVEGGTRGIVQINSTSDAYLMFGDAAQSNRAWVGYSHAADQLSLHTASTITMDGNVGIGRTSPSQKLDVAGSAIISGSVGIGTTSPTVALDVVGASTLGVLAVKNSANARDTFRSSNAAGTKTLSVSNGADGRGLFSIMNSGGTTTNFINGSGNSYFNGGNVGIGTTSPSEKLEVAGTIKSRDVKLDSDYHLMRSNHHSGHLEGGYNNVGNSIDKSSPIYTIGSSYNPTDAALSNMYGIGYTHSNASFINFTGANGWGQYVAADGDARIFLCGTNGVISSTGEHYVGSSRVFHDSYHPNADTLTTARTINGVSFNGSANITVADSTKLPLAGGTLTGGLNVAGNIAANGYLSTDASSSRSKLRLYGTSNLYAIGMQSGGSYGGLGADWAMTFQFSNNSARGFWWGDDAHTLAQGAMALTTDGRLTVASKIKVGFGESDTTSPDAPLQIASGTTLPITTAPNGSITFGSLSSTTTPTILGRTTNNRSGLSLLSATTNANVGGDMLFNVRENNNTAFGTLTNTAFRFQHFTTDLLRILRNGNVGIGTTSPTEKLHVAGNIVADNFLSHTQVMSHSIGTYTASTINSATASNEGGGMGLAAGASSTGQAAVKIDRYFAAGRGSGQSTRLDQFNTVVGVSFMRTFADDTEAFINIGTAYGTPVAPTETTKGVFVVLKKASGVYTLELHHNRGTAATNSSTSATVSVNISRLFQIEVRTTIGGTIEVFTSNLGTPPALLLSLTGLTFGQNGGANDNNVWIGYRSTGYTGGNYGIGVTRVYSGYYRT